MTRPEHRAGRDRRRQSRTFDDLPEFRRLRRFVLKMYRLFDPDPSPDLALLGTDTFDKMIAYLHGLVAHRVRTNNHVGRTNRRPRHFEKVRHQWHQRQMTAEVRPEPAPRHSTGSPPAA